MVARRIIPCLDVRDDVVVKGVRFRDHRVVGDILELAARYAAEGADELVFYDITASPEDRTVAPEWVRRVARCLDIPFTVAGGIRSVDDAAARLENGAEKISINSPALERPDLIDDLVREFGTQCVVVGIDSREQHGDFEVYQYTGSEAKSRSTRRRTLDWIREITRRGAGEIVLNCMDRDGVGRGYDIAQLKAARAVCPAPLIASGGAGSVDDFLKVFREADVDGALAAGVFHRQEIGIPDLKARLRDMGVEMRS